MSLSILDQARADGYREGYNHRRFHEAQSNMIDYDTAFEEGRQVGESEHPSRFFWFIAGAVTISLLAWFLCNMVGSVR